MNKKIIFFDVDGTLVDVRPAREYVPESTIKAVRNLPTYFRCRF